MTTFALHWRRGTDEPDREAADALARGLSRLRPDPIACWSRGPFTLWHFAEDPWFSVHEHPAGFVAVIAGRLDAFADLVHSVGGTGAVGENPTDAAVLAAAYAKWGPACLPRLLGDFVAIVWEPRERTLLIARDRVGVAPLYYWESTEDVVVAGHLGGVLAYPGVPAAANEGYIAEVLAWDIRSATETLYQGVGRVPAGLARLFGERGARSWKWAPSYSLAVMPWSSAEADECYRETLTTAITDRMRGSALVGAELSGGLDSSTVVALGAPHMQRLAGHPLRTYSLTFPGRECDETPYIQLVVDTCDVRASLIPALPLDPERWMAEITATRDLPLTPNTAAWSVANSSAHEHGVRALLTGQGGDQGFDVSVNYPLELALEGRLLAATRTARRLYPEAGSIDFLGRVARPVISHAVHSLNPGFRSPRIPQWIDADFARRTNLEERLAKVDRPLRTVRERRAKGYRSSWEAVVFEKIRVFDALTGVRAFHPFFDPRVIQLSLNLDESHRWADGQFRTIQRRAMAGRLPRSVVARTTKADFTHLFVEEFRACGPQPFSSMQIASERGWIAGEALAAMYRSVEAAVASGTTAKGLWDLMMVLSVERWHRVVGAR